MNEKQLFHTPVGAITVSPAKKLNFKEFVKENREKKRPIKFMPADGKFQHWFLSKTEEFVNDEAALRFYTPIRHLDDISVITQLGGEAKVETSLLEIFACLEKQPDGEEGVLLVNRFDKQGWLANPSRLMRNVFYVRDYAGFLRTVNIGYYKDGWHFTAQGFADTLGFGEGDRIFIRAS